MALHYEDKQYLMFEGDPLLQRIHTLNIVDKDLLHSAAVLRNDDLPECTLAQTLTPSEAKRHPLHRLAAALPCGKSTSGDHHAHQTI